MAGVDIPFLMEIFMKERIQKIHIMEREELYVMMEACIKDRLRMERKMVMGHMFGLMEIRMKVIG